MLQYVDLKGRLFSAKKLFLCLRDDNSRSEMMTWQAVVRCLATTTSSRRNTKEEQVCQTCLTAERWTSLSIRHAARTSTVQLLSASHLPGMADRSLHPGRTDSGCHGADASLPALVVLALERLLPHLVAQVQHEEHLEEAEEGHAVDGDLQVGEAGHAQVDGGDGALVALELGALLV